MRSSGTGSFGNSVDLMLGFQGPLTESGSKCCLEDLFEFSTARVHAAQRFKSQQRPQSNKDKGLKLRLDGLGDWEVPADMR